MAKQRRKQTAEERAIIDAEREAVKMIDSELTQREELQQNIDENFATLPEGVKAVILEPTPEGMAIMHRAIAEAVGESEEEETEEEKHDRISIVKDKFKRKYIENAAARGETKKAAKRSNWDWLAQELATFCLSEKGKIEIGSFTDILDANGIDHSRWTNRNPGWQGRFRMTGRVALQKTVANSGSLRWPDGSVTEAPADFIERYKTKA